jgi:hypothetical protein
MVAGVLIFGEVGKIQGEKFLMGRFGEEERQEDDSVLGVVLFLQTAWLVVEILYCASDLVE